MSRVQACWVRLACASLALTTVATATQYELPGLASIGLLWLATVLLWQLSTYPYPSQSPARRLRYRARHQRG